MSQVSDGVAPDPERVPSGAGLRVDGGRRRRLVGLVAAGVVVLLVGLVTVVVTRPADPAAGPEPGGSPSPTAEPVWDQLPLTAAEDGGQLRIVESGFSPLVDVAGEPLVTWGLIVENTSQVTAAAVDVSVDILDSDGNSLVTEISSYAKDREIGLIMPGQRAGIGDATYVTSADAAEVSFELHDPWWWPEGNPHNPVAALTVTEIAAYRQEGERVVMYWGDDGIAAYQANEGPVFLEFRVDSAYQHILTDPSAQAIFRDRDGAIVGGTHPADTDLWATIPPGWSIQRIRVREGPPEPADLTRTEIYAYPGCC